MDLKGKVVTSLNHERLGHRKLARPVDSHGLLKEIFSNPRIHTNRGRYVGQNWLLEDPDDEYLGWIRGGSEDRTEQDRTDRTRSSSKTEQKREREESLAAETEARAKRARKLRF